MVREGSDLCLIQALTLLTSAMNEEFHKNLTHDIWSPDRDWSLNTPSYEWMSMEQGGMILTGENCNTGREICPNATVKTQVSLVNKRSNFILWTCRQHLSNLQDAGTATTQRTYFILLDNQYIYCIFWDLLHNHHLVSTKFSVFHNIIFFFIIHVLH